MSQTLPIFPTVRRRGPLSSGRSWRPPARRYVSEKKRQIPFIFILVSNVDKRADALYLFLLARKTDRTGWWPENKSPEFVVICYYILLLLLGKNDGSVKGVRYFSCGAKRGVFVRPDKVLLDKRGRAVRNNNPGSSTKPDNSLMRRSTSKGMSNEPQNVLLIH